MFLTDSPLENNEQDQLGRKELAYKIKEAIRNYDEEECLTIGIYGGWGEGKTSLANMILDELSQIDNKDEPKYCIIKFDPWLFSNQKDLITQLFTSISEVFKYSDCKGIKDTAGDVMNVLSNAAKLAGHIPDPLIGTISKKVGKFFEDYSKLLKGESSEKDDFKPLTQLKYKISQTLQKENIKLVISIDDFDRLSQEEIRLMFQVVKVLGDFKNTIYLLLFDKDVVVASLQGVQGGEGDDYLKKIIQVPITLPPVTSEKIKEIIFDKFNDIIGYDSLSERDKTSAERLSREISIKIMPYIKNIRDVNRLINLFKFKYGFLGKEINPYDMLALCVIEVSQNDIYKDILENMNHNSNKTIKSDIWNYLTSKTTCDYEKLCFNNRFSNEEYRSLYFSFDLPPKIISSEQKDCMIFSYEFDKIFDIISGHIDDIPGLIDSIEIKVNCKDFPKERIPTVFQTIEICFLKGSHYIKEKIRNLAFDLICKMDQEQIEERFSEFEENPDRIKLMPLYTDILFLLEAKKDKKLLYLYKELVAKIFAVKSGRDIELDKIEQDYIKALADVDIFENIDTEYQKKYLLCKKINMDYIKGKIPSDYSQNKAALAIIYYEISEKSDDTPTRAKTMFYVNINEIAKFLDLTKLNEFLRSKETYDSDRLNKFFNISSFPKYEINDRIKAFLSCDPTSADENGICKVDYRAQIEGKSIEDFFEEPFL